MDDMTLQPVPSWTPPVPPEQRVLAAMRALAQGDVYQAPLAVLAQAVGVSLRQVQTLVRRLHATQHIRCLTDTHGGKSRPAAYALLPVGSAVSNHEQYPEAKGAKGEQKGEQYPEAKGAKGEVPLTGIQTEISPLGPSVPDLNAFVTPNGSLDPQRERPKTRPRTRAKTLPPPPPPGFLRCWLAYPSFRRLNKRQCLHLWVREALETQADTIAAHIQAMTATEEWTKEGGKYIPHFTSYLNGAHYETPPRPAPSRHPNGTSPAAGDGWDATLAYLKQRFPEEVQP